MSDYPEHEKLRAVQAETQAAGEFVDWLTSQGIHLMVWREDLTDERLTDPECTGKLDSDNPLPCYQGEKDPAGEGEPKAWWRRHCLHWSDEERPAAAPAKQGHCCRCGKGRYWTIHNVKRWWEPDRNLQALLADWSGIDQNKIEAEKRAMLDSLRAMNAPVPLPVPDGHDTKER